LGEKFIHKSVLNLRCKFGVTTGKSLFQFDISEDLMKIVWEDIENSVDDAVKVFLDDKDFKIIRRLEENIIKLIGCSSSHTNCSGKSEDFELKRRIKLAKEVLSSVCLVNIPLEEFDESNSNEIFRYVLASAVNERDLADGLSTWVDIPFESAIESMRMVNWSEQNPLTPLINIITGSSQQELLEISKLKNENPTYMFELPCIWEALFMYPTGLAHKPKNRSILCETMTKFGWGKALVEIMRSIMKSMTCCSVYMVIDGLWKLLDELETTGLFWEVLSDVFVHGYRTVLSLFAESAKECWKEDVGIAKCFIRGVVSMCLKVSKNDMEWFDKLRHTIPVEILILGEENSWTELVDQVKEAVRVGFVSRNSFWEFCCNGTFVYNRLCDWYRLLLEIPDFKEKVPTDYRMQTEKFVSWERCLICVSIAMFGLKNTREGLNGLWSFPYGRQTFWRMANYKKDFELLHVAVQIGSIDGVQMSAFPGLLSWKNPKHEDLTALEMSVKEWGHDHEVTRFLQQLTGLLAPEFLVNSEENLLEPRAVEIEPISSCKSSLTQR